MENTQTPSKEPESILLSEFLENVPPNQEKNILNFGNWTGGYFLFEPPQIQLYCTHNNCNGTRFFRSSSEKLKPSGSYEKIFLHYVCGNCQSTRKTYSLRFNFKNHPPTCYKFGEDPVFGPPTSSRLIKLIGPDRDIFLKGRRCENKGLGIGAFAYYRRVVENQKDRILDQIIQVAEVLSAPDSQIQNLISAKKENQFSSAIEMVKDALPQSLLINGHNPLTLLHSALSKGLHEKTDEECLSDAHSIRVILSELSERLAQALKDETEVNEAISNLLNKKST